MVVFIYLYSINLILSIYVDTDSKFSDERGNFNATDLYFMRKTVFLENIISILHVISVVHCKIHLIGNLHYKLTFV